MKIPSSPTWGLSRRLAFRPDVAGLRDYQADGSRWLAAHPFGILADQMRLGKSAQALRALPPSARVVIVCPAIAQAVWLREVRIWRPDLTPTLDRLRRPGRGEVVITSYDSLPPAERGWTRKLIADPMGDVHLILDEVHMVKTATAARTRRCRLLGAQCATVRGLSGTPLLGHPEDLWGVLVSCRVADSIAPSFADFQVAFDGEGYLRLWELEKRGQMDRTLLSDIYAGAYVADWLREKLQGVMLRRTQASVALQMPTKQYEQIPVPAPADLKPFLDELNAQWLMVGANDLPPFELLSAARKALAKSRIPAALEWARKLTSDGEPLVVFSTHVEPILAFGDKAQAGDLADVSGVITGTVPASVRSGLVRDFETGKLRILALTMDTGGVAIDLASASRVLCVDLDWTPGINQQAEDRVMKVGKTGMVSILQMVSDHPLDVRVNEILVRKQRLIQNTVG